MGFSADLLTHPLQPLKSLLSPLGGRAVSVTVVPELNVKEQTLPHEIPGCCEEVTVPAALFDTVSV